MTSYLIIPLLDPNQSSRIEKFSITPENQQALLKKYYPECLVLDLHFVLTLSKNQEALKALKTDNVIDLETLCTKHRHAFHTTQLHPMGDAGTGVFLSPYTTLDPDLDCFIYSGHYFCYDQRFSKKSDKGLQIQIADNKILITAEGQRAGLIQHLPTDHTVPEDLSKQHVATENLFSQTYFVTIDATTVPGLDTHLCFPLRCLKPKIKITAGNTPLLLGFNYSPSYWAARKQAPLFFHPDGTLLMEQPYLFLLQTAEHKVTLAYATQKALAELCAQKYCLHDNSCIDFESVKLIDTENRFLAIQGRSI